MISRTACIAPLVLAGTLFAAHPAAAQDTGWSWENSTEVGFVTTSGNASQTTLSLKSSLTGTSGANTF
ncbi:MAG: hypothetical protein KJO65_09770, partial [Gemmatimonadetes bacterium]|nr:hypothetical protein [Gemmatimonadota bacterium]